MGVKALEPLCLWCKVRMGLSPARRGEGWGGAGGIAAILCGWTPLVRGSEGERTQSSKLKESGAFLCHCSHVLHMSALVPTGLGHLPLTGHSHPLGDQSSGRGEHSPAWQPVLKESQPQEQREASRKGRICSECCAG